MPENNISDSSSVVNKSDIQSGRDTVVGNQYVYNNTGNVSFASLPANLRKQLEKDFYYRLNREVQETDFRIFIDKQVEFERPFLFFIHGFHDDRHGGLVKRLCEYTGKFFERGTQIFDIGSWVDEQENDSDRLIYSLKTKIQKVLDSFVQNKKLLHKLPKAFKKLDFVKDIPTLQEKIIAFELTIYTKYWTKEILAVLKNDLLASMLDFKLQNPKQPLFLYIHLIYEPEKSGIKSFFGNPNKKNEKEIEQFYSENKNKCFLFKQLGKIKYNHATQFFKKYAMIDVNNYFKEDEELSFDTFFDKCKDELATIVIKENDKAI